MRYGLRMMFVGIAVLAAIGGAIRYMLAVQYPYGWSHCCDSGVYHMLQRYADDHGGQFPCGQATAEASLSLLYPEYIDAYTLRGKSVPLSVVEATLARDGLLGPDSCGWHYVEGLHADDDPELALFWDKPGLGHNGERLSGRRVYTIGHGNLWIADSEWPDFLVRQQQLLAARDNKCK